MLNYVKCVEILGAEISAFSEICVYSGQIWCLFISFHLFHLFIVLEKVIERNEVVLLAN